MSIEVTITEALKTQRVVALQGASHSHLALILAQLANTAEALGKPLCVVTAEDSHASELAEDLSFFLGERKDPSRMLPEVLLLPAIETTPWANVSADRTSQLALMAGLYRLTGRDERLAPRAVVMSAATMCKRVLPSETFEALQLEVSLGDEPGRDELLTLISRCGYARTPVVDDPGTFSARGGIIDVFPPLSRFPVRIEFFGDTVEQIRLFDPASQRTLRGIQKVSLHPVSEAVRNRELLDEALPLCEPRKRLFELADELGHPIRATRALIEEVESGRDFLGLDALVPAFHERLDPIWSYFREPLWVVVDPDGLARELGSLQTQSEQAYRARIEQDWLAFPPEAFFVSAEETIRELSQSKRVEVQVAGSQGLAERAETVVIAESRDNADVVAELKRARAERGEVILKSLAERLDRWTTFGQTVVIAAGSVAHLNRLEALLQAHQVALSSHREPGAMHLLSQSPMPKGVHLQAGSLSRGFRVLELVVLSHEEVFGPKTTRRPPRRVAGLGLGDLGQLSEGDYVVHVEHGIGRYKGLCQLDLQGASSDFLLLEYLGGDRLYLPVHRLNQVSKYVGADGTRPKLDKLGGTTFQKKKKKVQADVRALGEELLQLYAQRAALQGHAFDAPGEEMVDFEESFPFTETPDQQQAIDEVLVDLQSPHPMDRLVCGDVGFGKTEVALRAAFMVAMAGKQVAVLAPTTVLVEQHFRSFSERMGAYPLRVESVSRFRRRKELTEVIEGLASGSVDIAIGTHRLLSADIAFKRIGLIVVDEEQRFGVKHKEAMKRMRTQVDVLTLTATPIPRTLQMSMVGLREISVIATPPEDRLAIRTMICRYDEALIVEGVRKELARGGQVFFVHNEVQTIDEQAARLAELIPEARIGVGHGQMDVRRLERVMLQFVSGEFDILVCTTIIESGLDIPRANTMFVNRAERFGLAQLYQIRGRIGRGRRRAYCFLLVPGIDSMSDEARQRLEVLQRFTQLGSGFSIASYDLELRGAGDLLGAKQSGHIAAIGFEAYARILEEAVSELKGEPIVRETDPDLKIALPAFIPDDYVEDTGQRLEMYKRLSDVCRDEGAVHDLVAELRDRYGPAPAEVEALADVMVIKGLAVSLHATLVDLGQKRLVLRLADSTPLSARMVVQLAAAPDQPFKLMADQRLVYSFSPGECGWPLRSAKKVLRQLASHASQTG
jgi:transcription-repair coupling factor (superfamily II helicase)